MANIARRNLLADWVRLLISIGGVAFAVVLILVVKGLYEGFSDRVGSFAESVPADVWVTERDEHGFTFASNFPESRVADIAAIDGVQQVFPMYAERIQVVAGGKHTDIYLLAFEPSSDWKFAVPAPGTIVIDRVFARDTGLKTGELLTVRDKTFEVTGIANLADAGLSQFALISAEDARSLFAFPGLVDYALVRVEPGADPAAVANEINASVPEVQASTKADFAAINRREVTATFRPVVGVLVVVVLVVGVAVVGLTIYTATIERVREYGLLKALGATGFDLFRVVLVQSLAVCLVGCALGIPIALLVNQAAERSVPEFITLVRWQDVALVFLAAIAMAVLATLIPLRRIASVEPASVFRA